MHPIKIVTSFATLSLIGLAAAVLSPRDAASQEPVRVCASTPNLASLVEAVGGDAVSVTVFAKPGEDPHFVEARPSFIRALNDADLLVVVGLDLEAGWMPALIRTARNPRIRPGAGGYLDASTAIRPLDIPTVEIDRSMGDVHAHGNPHYLIDPVHGIAVAARIRDRLQHIRPAARAHFAARYRSLERELGVALVGAELLEIYGADAAVKLARLDEAGKLEDFLARAERAAPLAGWLGRLRALRGTAAVDEHDLWPYFARRFGLRMVGHLEPRPGIPPTTRHLTALIEIVAAEKARVILTAPYYNPRHAAFVSGKTGARVAAMAHQVGSQPGTQDYPALIDYNVRQLVSAITEEAAR